MAVVHKLIQGGETWLPFAMSQLRAIAALGMQHVTQRFVMSDGAKVCVRIAGDQHYVSIEGDESSYEFFTTEHINPSDPIPDGYPARFSPGSGTRLSGLSARPVFSNIFEPDPANPKWWKPADPWLKYENGVPDCIIDNKKYFQTWAYWQQEKHPEHVWWPNNGSNSLVTSTQAFGAGILSQCGWYSLAGPPPLYGTFSDVGYDVPPTLYDASGSKVGAPALEPNVWWRRAAVQTVTSTTYGSRKFFIMTDSHGRFHIYPAQAYQKTIEGEYGYLFLPSSMFKTFTPPYPAWVYRPAIGVEVDFSGFVWTFNKDATKAVTTPFHRLPGELWHPTITGYSGPDPILSITLKPIYRDFGVGGYPITLTANATTRACVDDTPGLFEVNIQITITGPGLMDYSASLTAGATDFHGNNVHAGGGRYYVDAGYLLKNKRFGDIDKSAASGAEAAAALGAPEDALLTAEIEVWGDTTPLARDGYPWGDPYYSQFNAYAFEDGVTDALTARYASADITSYYVVREHATQKEIRRFKITQSAGWLADGLGGRYVSSGSVDPLTAGIFNAIDNADLRTLSFIVRRQGNGTHPVGSDTRLFEVYTANAHVAGPAGNSGVVQADKYLQAEADIPAPAGSFVKLPNTVDDADAAKLLKQGAAMRCVAGTFTAGVYVHPQGHWAVSPSFHGDPAGELDIIQAYRGANPLKRTSHKAAFNKAFGQARDYTFYGAGAPTDFDAGNFASAGIWKTF